MSSGKSTAQQHLSLPFLNTLATSWSPVAMHSTLAKEECALPPDTKDNFSRYSKFLVKESNGVDGMGGGDQHAENERREALVWVDTLGEDACAGYDWVTEGESPSTSSDAPRPFSLLSWNILAQSLYEAQYQRRKVQQVALSTHAARKSRLPPAVSNLASTTTSPHPHPWPKRAKRVLEILAHYNADVVCLQECELSSFREDLLPAMSLLGYDGVAQEDDRSEGERPMGLKEATKHRYPRNHIVATFWKREKFEPVGEALVRTRSLGTVLRLKSDAGSLPDDENVAGEGPEVEDKAAVTPTVAVVNVHLEGHPRRFSERTHQLLHAMTDLAKRVEHERATQQNPTKLNALLLAGDFNCELQSSACATYLRMGRLGRQAGLGGVHGEDSLVLPPALLGTAECAEVIQPIMEWGRALPEERLADMEPHPFRRNGMTSAYPAWLGRDDAREHFTFCSELSKRPVPGLDQLWFSSMTLERRALMRNFVDDAALWERYFYDDAEVERRREDERRSVLASGLPSLECRYPSDHLPIGAIFDWNWDDCGDACLLDDEECRDACAKGVRGLNVIGSEGNDVQDDTRQGVSQQEQRKMERPSFETPHEELDYLIDACPYDSDEQRSDVRFILSPLDPPLCLTSKERPTQEQMEQLEARRARKAELLARSSLGVRPWLKDIWKASKQAGKLDRQREVEKMRSLAKSGGG